MIINRAYSFPNKWTFRHKPIRELLERYGVGPGWCDPFAGESLLAQYRNDFAPERRQPLCLEAEEFMERMSNAIGIVGVLFDPPYSPTQASRSYKETGRFFPQRGDCAHGYRRVRDWVPKVLQPGGICISFGFNTTGMGKSRGFKKLELLIVAHGANHNDTLCTVEVYDPIGKNEESA